MKIGIIGAGMVGGALTKAFARRGHEVVVSSSNPKGEKMSALIEATGKLARAVSNAEAAAHGEVVVLATPWEITEQVVRSLDLGGKIILDATNPIAEDFSGLVQAEGLSGAEQIAQWAPGAHVVKALNQISFELMDAPVVSLGEPIMWVAGDDEPSKRIVCALVNELGLSAEDC